MFSTLILVSCGQSKQSKSCQAKDMYTSTLFKAARAYAETFGDYWYILSASCGLLRPEQVIEPYERSLLKLPPDLVRQWSAWCQADFAGFCLEHPEYVAKPKDPRAHSKLQNLSVVVLAGKGYVEPLRACGFGDIMEMPLEGMQIGQRIQWLQQGVRRASGIERH